MEWRAYMLMNTKSWTAIVERLPYQPHIPVMTVITKWMTLLKDGLYYLEKVLFSNSVRVCGFIIIIFSSFWACPVYCFHLRLHLYAELYLSFNKEIRTSLNLKMFSGILKLCLKVSPSNYQSLIICLPEVTEENSPLYSYSFCWTEECQICNFAIRKMVSVNCLKYIIVKKY